MKNKLIKLFTLLFICLTANISYAAYEVSPLYSRSLVYTGIGFVKVPNELTIYRQPDLNSEVIHNLDVKKYTGDNVVETYDIRDYVSIYRPDEDLIYLQVTSEDGSGWFEVIVNQQTGERGWVYTNQDDFWTLRKFYDYYGRKNGLYLMRDIEAKYKTLYYGPYEAAKVKHAFTIVKHIKMIALKDNWMMVKITEFDNKCHLGWIRWRLDNGQITIFPIVK